MKLNSKYFRQQKSGVLADFLPKLLKQERYEEAVLCLQEIERRIAHGFLRWKDREAGRAEVVRMDERTIREYHQNNR